MAAYACGIEAFSWGLHIERGLSPAAESAPRWQAFVTATNIGGLLLPGLFHGASLSGGFNWHWE